MKKVYNGARDLGTSFKSELLRGISEETIERWLLKACFGTALGGGRERGRDQEKRFPPNCLDPFPE